MARTTGGESQGASSHDRDVVFVGVRHHLAHDGVAEPVEIFMGMVLDGGQQPAQPVVEGLPRRSTQAVGVEQQSRASGQGLGGHNAVAVGDAENDLRLFDACEIAVAVANAAPVLQAQADIVLPAPAGEGVLELLQGPLLEPGTSLSSLRWRMTLGHADGVPVQLPASPSQILVAGDSGAGKSFLTVLIVEQLAELENSGLVIDPEGDHAPLSRLPGVMTIGRDG